MDRVTADAVLNLSVDRLTDHELSVLIGSYRDVVGSERLSPGFREWYRSLAAALTSVEQRRSWQWQQVLADPAVPPDWDTAVAALPPESPGNVAGVG